MPTPLRITVLSILALGAILIAVCRQPIAQSDEPARARQPVPRGESKENGTDGKKTERQIDMRSKLNMVQKIVEGISTENFDMIDKGGMELIALAESAAWKSHHDPYYRHYSANFEHAARGLIAAAKSKSVEKATFAYVHVTISCTACHQQVRGTVRVAR